MRRDLHRHPEVSGEEERTAGVVAERLRGLGLEVRTGVGGHGVVALLQGAEPGPVVAFRADMDAVPSQAPDPVEFRSLVPGVRHICGHDIHTTIGLALAEGLVAVRDRLPGAVMLVFQPAEENATGARAMIADGALKDPQPAAIFAYHTAPMPVGQLATAPITLMPGRDRVRVRLTGEGDLEGAAAVVRELIQEVGTIPPQQSVLPALSREFILARVGSATQDAASGAFEVVGVVTTASATARARARDGIEHRLAALRLDRVVLDHDYEERWIAGVTNEPELVRRASASARSLLGEEAVLQVDSIIPAFSEDFGSFQEEVPGVMFFLGVSNLEKGWIGMPHTPDYVADEESIFVGASAMAAVLLDFLAASTE